MIRLVGLVPVEVDDPFTQFAFEHDLFVHSVEKPGSYYFYVQSSFIGSTTRLYLLHLDVEESE